MLHPLFAYSLVPVLSVAYLLCFTAALRGRNAVGLASFCAAVAIWCSSLLLGQFPATQEVGDRLVAIGAFASAGYLHAAFDLTKQRSYALVVFAYVVATAVTVVGGLAPGVIYHPADLHPGPMFWPTMALAVVSATVPLVTLARAYKRAGAVDRPGFRTLFIAGVCTYVGSFSNALLLAYGLALPFGIFLVLAGLLVLANLIRAHEPPAERKLLERSLTYSALTAFLSAGFLFGVMALMGGGTPLLAEYRVGALFLLFMAALAFEPLRQQLVEWVGRRFLSGHASIEVARALEAQEARADQARRLAELGQFTSAVAHEIRNPLGVLSAHLKLLERKGVEAETLSEMGAQIERARRFVDELLRYGRPRPLELRMVDVSATLDLAYSTAKQALAEAGPVTFTREGEGLPPLEADQAQLSQVLVILFENALLAVKGGPAPALRASAQRSGSELLIRVEDNGPGIPPELVAKLFAPFVTGRRREGAHGGTGLGLAIARGIVERHCGRIRTLKSEALGGACFEVVLPLSQPLVAAGREAHEA